MSESSKDASNILKLSPPRSLMNLEDAEEIWRIITKRYPKAAPLLCEMETVLDHAEDLLEHLKSPSDLGIVLSTDESLSVEESEEAVSDKSNLCERSLAKSVEFDTPSLVETEEFNLNYLTLPEMVLTANKNSEVSFISEDSKINATSFCPTYTVSEADPFFDEVRNDRQENLENPIQQHSAVSKQRELTTNTTLADNISVNCNKGSRPSSASKILGKPTATRLLQSPRRPRTHSEEPKIVKTAPKLKDSPRKNSNMTEVSIPQFKKVVETIKSKEYSQMAKKTKNLKTDTKPHEKSEEVAGILRMKEKDSNSIDEWDKVVGNSSKSCEASPVINAAKLDRNVQSQLTKISPDRPINKINASSKSTTKPLNAEANIKMQSKEGNQKNEKMAKTEIQGYGDEKISIASVHESPVRILEQYANFCNKKINYIANDDRKDKIEIKCHFANYKVSSIGKVQEVVKNEAAARMLHMLATSQMEENLVGDLPKFSRQQILEIMNLQKGDTFIPSVKKTIMVRLYNLCLEQDLPEPQYEVKTDKQCGFLSTYKILNYIGQGSGRTDRTAKEKAAEDFYKKHFEKLRNPFNDN